jgi:hypothetical protein
VTHTGTQTNVNAENLLVARDGRVRQSRRLADRYKLCIDSFGPPGVSPREEPNQGSIQLSEAGEAR